MSLSQASLLASQPQEVQSQILASLSDEQLVQLQYDWRFWARPEQLAPPGDWLTWVILAGRGFGKTKGGAEWVREQVYAGKKRIALIGETYKDLVEVMCFGDSGLASVFPPDERPKIVANPNVQIEFHTGAIALGYNATQPAQLRGPQFDAAWCDELAKWKKAQETWDMLQFGLRLGEHPRTLVTTTPRNIPTLRAILEDKRTVTTYGKTSDNAGNLAATFLEQIYTKYAGTRLGRQELSAELLIDVPGALWTMEMFDKHRVDEVPELQRVVVAVDPSGTKGEEEDEGDDIGIVVAGKGVDGRAYVLADATCKLSPKGWGGVAIHQYNKWQADRIVAETNYGGAMVESVIRSIDPMVSYKAVTASRGKVVRAEPVSALYEQGRVSHLGTFADMEDECCLFTPNGYMGNSSPNRADALVWAITELDLEKKVTAKVFL